MTTIQLYGRLGRYPEGRITTNGKPMVTGSMVVNLAREGEPLDEWFSLVAFGRTGEALALHAKGDLIAVSGRLTKSTWRGKDGQERGGFSVLVDSVASARTARPEKAKGVNGANDEAPFYDDDSLRENAHE